MKNKIFDINIIPHITSGNILADIMTKKELADSVCNLKDQIDHLKLKLCAIQTANEEVRAERNRYKEVLQIYADSLLSHKDCDGKDACGKAARNALKGEK